MGAPELYSPYWHLHPGASFASGPRAAATCASAPATTVAPTAPSVAFISPAPTSIQGSAAANAVGSSFVVPAQRRYHTWVGPNQPTPSHPRPARRVPPPKRAGLQAQGSIPPRDPEPHPHNLIRALLEPQTHPLHPLSGSPTSIAAPSQGMLTAVGEIYMGMFNTISRHFPRPRSSETPCSSCRDTIWSRS